MAKEIERKYRAALTQNAFYIALHEAEEVVFSTQSYLVSKATWEWRIRCLERVKHPTKSSGELTWYTAIKLGNGFVRDEYETKLPAWFGKFLLRLAPVPIYKTRFSEGGWEVDVFHSPPTLNGLILAEAEVDHEHSPFPEVPAWVILGEDVTNHGGYSNKNLCLYGLPN